MKAKKVLIVGGGLAGSEAAYYLASHGIETTLVEMKPKKFTPHTKVRGMASWFVPTR